MQRSLFDILSEIFVDHQLSIDSETLEEYSLALNGSKSLPGAIVWPENEEQLIQLIRAANQFHFEIHPVAQGKNWGYGTAQGSKSGQVIANLSRMNSVLEINDQQAYVRVQPGISQSQLYRALQAQSSLLQLDITAAGLHTSVVGNILERGFGHTDYTNRFGNVLAMRVLLPTGEVINTGMGMYSTSKAEHLYPYGIGPILSGLFTQSNLGIVLEMTIALQPKPEYQATVLVMCKDDHAAPDMVATIAKLKLDGVVTSGVHTASMTRAIGEQAAKTAGAWVLTTSLAGPKSIVKARFKHFKRTILANVPNSKVLMFDDFRWDLLSKLNRYLKSPMIASLKLVIDLKKGVPSDEAMKTLLDTREARSCMKTSEFPACFRWICAVSSFLPQDIKQMLGICRHVFKKYGYEERYTMTNVSERAVVLIANIRYDNTDDQLKKAAAFYQELDHELITAGFCPYRSGPGMFDSIQPHLKAPHLALLKKLKQTMDPNNILSPNKYWLDGQSTENRSEFVKKQAQAEEVH